MLGFYTYGLEHFGLRDEQCRNDTSRSGKERNFNSSYYSTLRIDYIEGVLKKGGGKIICQTTL